MVIFEAQEMHMSPIKILSLLAAFACCLRVDAQLQCDNDTSYLRSLIDLKTGHYLGFQGGLYPDGSNTMPYEHMAAGMNISREVMPLDADGNVDLANGKVGFICLGASTAGNAFNHFKDVADADPTINPCLRIVNCALGAKGLEIMIDTVSYAWYWNDNVIPEVYGGGLNPKQVQIIWVMVTSRIDTVLTWPDQPLEVTNKYEELMHVILGKFPNIKQVYLTGFNYGGYADPTKEFFEMIVEPSSYWTNWSVKFLVERQIDGDADLQYSGPERNSPWIGWGPHVWADGTRANVTDHLRWKCDIDYKPDGGGYHLSDYGKAKIAKVIYNFYKNDPVAADWFNYSARWVSCDPAFRESVSNPEPSVSVYPNPATDQAVLTLEGFTDGGANVMLVDASGSVVSTFSVDINSGFNATPVDLTGLPTGMYYIRVSQPNAPTYSGVIVKQ